MTKAVYSESNTDKNDNSMTKTSMFSTRGRIRRGTFIKRLILTCLIVVSSPFAMMAYEIAVGIPSGNLSQDWVTQSLLWVVKKIGIWVDPVWILAFVMLIAARVYGCAVVQRARDIEVEIRFVLLVPVYLLYKANMGKLMFRRSIETKPHHA